MSDLCPIFVIGSARHGTTWLGNTISAMPPVVGANHWIQWGSDESNICRNHCYWGDFANLDTYIEFLELYSSSDFFNLVEGDKEYFYRHRAESFLEFFLELMDRFARQNNATYWTTKFDPYFFHQPLVLKQFISLLESRYGQVKFIAIQRNYLDAIKSYLLMPGRYYRMRRRFPFLYFAPALAVARNVSYSKQIKKFIDQFGGLHLNYEDLKINHEQVFWQIVNYLEMKNVPIAVPDQKFSANSSFYRAQDSEVHLPWRSIKIFCVTLNGVFGIVPILAWWIVWFFEYMKTPRIPFYRRLLKMKYFRKELIEELESAGEYALIDIVQHEGAKEIAGEDLQTGYFPLKIRAR